MLCNYASIKSTENSSFPSKGQEEQSVWCQTAVTTIDVHELDSVTPPPQKKAAIFLYSYSSAFPSWVSCFLQKGPDESAWEL